VAYEPEGTNKVSPQAKPGERRDFEEVKHRILELLKKGPQETVYLLENAGAPGNRPILYRMLAAKQIKKAGKGKYKL
jgi:hypothetical protein